MLPGFPMMLFGGKPKPPAIGQPWEGGNYIGDILDGGVWYALILAPKSSGQNNSLQWKTVNTFTSGTGSTTNGLANSNAMNSATHPAAQFCRGRTIGGFSDWYLPAKDELNLIYTNKGVISGVDAIDSDTTYYWSSTENSAADAWVQNFSYGVSHGDGKTNSYRARAVRRLAI